MFVNIISKRALPISRMFGSQVRTETSIYGVEVKSTAKFSYSAAIRTKDIQNDSKAEPFFQQKTLSDYSKFVIAAECELCANLVECIHTTLWEVSYDCFRVTLKDIHPRNETCHAEVLFGDNKSCVMQKVRKEFEVGDEAVEGFENPSVVIRILEEKQKFLKEFENRWAKDVTFVVNGEKCAGDRQYLSAISPVFKKMLQDHAQDEITLEGVESADVLKDFFLAVSPLRVQPNPSNVVSLLKLAHACDIPFLMRSCEDHLKICYEIPNVDRLFLALKYGLKGLKFRIEKSVTNKDLAEILKKKKEMLSEPEDGFLFDIIAERLENDSLRK
ncbi:BTB/POZ domain-containing protein [Ditylenchus destructor]|nr:BTB/POZ domain-containing protein [Ditylenchus destructor]